MDVLKALVSGFVIIGLATAVGMHGAGLSKVIGSTGTATSKVFKTTETG
jgi:hypothetical protein